MLRGYENILDGLSSIYFEKFHKQYPIFWQQGFDSYSVSSVIFLSMVSIGCAFAGQVAFHYGAALHDRLSLLFTDWFSIGIGHDQGLLCLIFGFLTEAGGLLFHPDQGGRARELHQIVIGHARNLRVFDHTNLSALSLKTCFEYTGLPEGILQQWLEQEMKKRVVLAILHHDLYLAKIHGTLPLVTGVKVSLPLLCPDDLWTYIGHDWCHRITEASSNSILGVR